MEEEKKIEEYNLEVSDYPKDEIVIWGDNVDITVIPAAKSELSIRSTVKPFEKQLGKIVFFRCQNAKIEIMLPKKISGKRNYKELEIALLGNNFNIKTVDSFQFNYSVNLVMIGLGNKLNSIKVNDVEMVTHRLNDYSSNQPNWDNPNKRLTKSNPNI